MFKRIIMWDWKGQPNINDLDRAIGEVGRLGPVHLTEVPNTGMDMVAVVIAHRPLTADQANETFRTWLEESND